VEHSRNHIAKTQKLSEEQGEKTQLKYCKGNKAQVTCIIANKDAQGRTKAEGNTGDL